jgi:2-methylcitrate dehydratase PrpD
MEQHRDAFRLNRRLLLKGAVSGVAGVGCFRAQLAQAQPSSTGSTLTLARTVNRISFAGLPPEPIQHAKMILASTFASAAAGSQLGSVRIVRDLAKEQGGRREAPVWFDGARLPSVEAARVNAMLSDSAASDDSDLRNVAHTGTCLASVGLALAERAGSSGEDLLSAIVAGYEAAGRIGEAIAASAPEQSADQSRGAVSGTVGRGFHASSVVAFGGAVTAAKLLHLTDEQMAQAIALTATSVGGLAIGTNSWAREYHAGNAAVTAIHAALAASRGYTANPDMLEAQGGFLSVFGGGRPEAGALARETGVNYQITRYLAIKLLPGAHALHPAVEAALNAARQSGAAPENVARILVAGPQSGLAAGKPPADVIQAIHSLPYYIASAVADRDFSWASAEPEKIGRPPVQRLMALVQEDPAPPPVRYEWTWGATVTIVTKAGGRYASTVDAPKGSAPRGIQWSDVDAKYRALMPASGLAKVRIEQALQLIHTFNRAKLAAQLTALIA